MAMPESVAVTGFAGAGKTSAVDFWENSGIGRRTYVGQLVIDEVISRGLAINPEVERKIRLEFGPNMGPLVWRS